MHNLRIPTLIVAVLMIAPLGLAPSSAANQLDYEYVLAPTVALPGLRTNVALCDDPDDSCIGGVLFRMEGSHVSASPDDHLLGTNVGLLLCVWEHEGETCRAGDHFDGAACGSRNLVDVPPSARNGAVFIYGVYVDSDLEVCGASQGTLHLSFA